jgi:isocitrate lyase
MLAYVQLVQRKEKVLGCDVLTHQKWSVCWDRFLGSVLTLSCRSGANYIDRILSIVSSGSSSTSSTGS